METKVENGNERHANILCFLYNSHEFRRVLFDFIRELFSGAGLAGGNKEALDTFFKEDGRKVHKGNYFWGEVLAENATIKDREGGGVVCTVLLNKEGEEAIKGLFKTGTGKDFPRDVSIYFSVSFVITPKGENTWCFNRELNSCFQYSASAIARVGNTLAKQVFVLNNNSNVVIEGGEDIRCENIENFQKFLSLLFVYIASVFSTFFSWMFDKYLEAKRSGERWVFISPDYFVKMMRFYGLINNNFRDEKFKNMMHNSLLCGTCNYMEWGGWDRNLYYYIDKNIEIKGGKYNKKKNRAEIDVLMTVFFNMSNPKQKGWWENSPNTNLKGAQEMSEDNPGALAVTFVLKFGVETREEEGKKISYILDIEKKGEEKIKKFGDFDQMIFIANLDGAGVGEKDIFATSDIRKVPEFEKQILALSSTLFMGVIYQLYKNNGPQKSSFSISAVDSNNVDKKKEEFARWMKEKLFSAFEKALLL